MKTQKAKEKLVKLSVLAVTATAFGLTQASSQQMPPEMVSYLQSMVPKVNQLKSSTSVADLGKLTGLWSAEQNDDNQEIDLIHIIHVGPFVIQSIVNRETGNLTPIGYAEKSSTGWFGWFALACKGCCPGVSWWDKGTLSVNTSKKVLNLRAKSKKLDEDSCKFTEEPDLVTYDSKLQDYFDFAELIPGKLIHIVAAPQVGNQPAQYKAAVKVKWNIQGVGASKLDIAVRGPAEGSYLENKSSKLAGEREFVTTKSGKYTFLFAAYNSKDQPLHVEFQSIEIPRIPGVN